ncbi:MAG: heme exporter protein CcmB [Chloroflexi bacterium]|nr:heme exporter protein CcmB [Chloroflexota bacterium]
MSAFPRHVRALVWKDLLAELRSRELVLASVVFALLVLVIFSLAFDLRVDNAASVAPGVLWVTFTFAGVLSLGRSFARERDRGTLEGLLLAPMDRSALYLAKMTVNVGQMLVVELVALPVAMALFDLQVDLPRLVLALVLGTIGVAGVGTLFGAMAAHTRAREVLLPLLLFPIQMPVVLATVKSTAAAIYLDSVPANDSANWLGLLIAFDGLFLGLSVLLFDVVLEQE